MKRATLYSSSGRPRQARPSQLSGDPVAVPAAAPSAEPPPDPPRSKPPPSRMRRFFHRHATPLLLIAGALFALGVAGGYQMLKPPPRVYTQEDIDAAVLHTLETKTLPSVTAKAYDAIRESVVRVRAMGPDDEKGGEEVERGVGSGVVIVDKGIILTNLHVVSNAKRVSVVFAGGLESDAVVIGVQPEKIGRASCRERV